MKITLLTVPSD